MVSTSRCGRDDPRSIRGDDNSFWIFYYGAIPITPCHPWHPCHSKKLKQTQHPVYTIQTITYERPPPTNPKTTTTSLLQTPFAMPAAPKAKKISFRAAAQPTSLLGRAPHEIVGTQEWLENKAYYIPPEPHAPRARRRARSRARRRARHRARVPAAVLRNNDRLVENIRAHIATHNWQMIEGGEEHGHWINTHKYPDILFEPGQIKHTASARGVLFPLSDGAEDPHGIAFHFQEHPNGLYDVVTNKWYTLEDDTRRGRRAAKNARRKARRAANPSSRRRQRPLPPDAAYKPSSEAARAGTRPPTTNPRTRAGLSLEISE